MLSSESFATLCFTFRFMIHFKSIHICYIGWGSFFYTGVPFPTPYIEKTVLSLLNYVCTFVKKISWLHLSKSISVLPVPSANIPHCLDECSFTVHLKCGYSESSTPVALFQNCFGYSSSFNFPYVISKNQSHSSHLLYGFLVLQKISIFTVVLYLVKTSSNIFSKYIMQMFITFDPIYPVPETYVKNAQI